MKSCLKTFNLYHDDPGAREEEELRLRVGISVPPETKVEGQIGKMALDGGKYAVARFELVPMDYQKAWSWLFGGWYL
jgi:AraC family transcriptional regulator